MYTWIQPVIDGLAYGLSLLHGWTQDWGAAIILLTVIVKLALTRVTFAAARQQLRTAAMQPQLRRLMEASEGDAAKRLEATAGLYRKYGVNPLTPFVGLLIQAPVLMAMYGLFLTHGALMTTVLVPWVANLALADPFHLVPLATAGISFLLGVVPLTDVQPAPMSTGQKLLIAALVTAVPLFITWKAPVALGLYMLTGSLFSLAERFFYRTPLGRTRLERGMPQAG